MLHLKSRLRNFLLRNLYNMITEDSFLRIEYNARTKKSAIIIGDERLSDDHVAELASEARMITHAQAYQKVIDSMKWTANEIITCKAVDMDTVNYGKGALYAIDVIDKKLKNMAKL